MNQEEAQKLIAEEIKPLVDETRDFAEALKKIEQIGHGRIPGACGDIAEAALDKHPGWRAA